MNGLYSRHDTVRAPSLTIVTITRSVAIVAMNMSILKALKHMTLCDKSTCCQVCLMLSLHETTYILGSHKFRLAILMIPALEEESTGVLHRLSTLLC